MKGLKAAANHTLCNCECMFFCLKEYLSPFCNLLGLKSSMQHFNVNSLRSVIRISHKIWRAVGQFGIYWKFSSPEKEQHPRRS